MKQAVGDIDFYPNGGEIQPGCSLLSFPLLSSITVEDMNLPSPESVSRHLVACAHNRDGEIIICWKYIFKTKAYSLHCGFKYFVTYFLWIRAVQLYIDSVRRGRTCTMIGIIKIIMNYDIKFLPPLPHLQFIIYRILLTFYMHNSNLQRRNPNFFKGSDPNFFKGSYPNLF